MVDTLITAVLALIMFSIGLSMQYGDFGRLFYAPRVLFLGLFLQLVALPCTAFVVASSLPLPPSFALGFLILAACPGGLSSNYISYLLRANTALAVSLTISNSSLALLTVPIIVNLALEYFLPGAGAALLPLLPTAFRIFLIVLVPVLAGMGFRHLLPRTAARLQPFLRKGTLVLLALVFLLKIAAPPEQGGSALTLEEVGTILPAALLINGVALSFGTVFGGLFGMNRDNQLTLGVEVGIQNTSLAFVIAGSFLDNEQALKPALVYAMFTFFTALGYGLLLKPDRYHHLRREFTGW
ncbi:bile acid:sodium symporter family protein [Neolewinella litorea]|uniref:Bile acid:sodium symporter family protein n=1 Tax=Neolewinella litorea TaxID=2562452 RepID=A0A4S4P0E4_9BACT|nr:bile acid:sodium symporter [Neolewinella litorea]THH42030.1 bile acid:sodium symporter family protein [Neolewinella litorea]